LRTLAAFEEAVRKLDILLLPQCCRNVDQMQRQLTAIAADLLLRWWPATSINW
jgi:hypothetical protein